MKNQNYKILLFGLFIFITSANIECYSQDNEVNFSNIKPFNIKELPDTIMFYKGHYFSPYNNYYLKKVRYSNIPDSIVRLLISPEIDSTHEKYGQIYKDACDLLMDELIKLQIFDGSNQLIKNIEYINPNSSFYWIDNGLIVDNTLSKLMNEKNILSFDFKTNTISKFTFDRINYIGKNKNYVFFRKFGKINTNKQEFMNPEIIGAGLNNVISLNDTIKSIISKRLRLIYDNVNKFLPLVEFFDGRNFIFNVKDSNDFLAKNINLNLKNIPRRYFAILKNGLLNLDSFYLPYIHESWLFNNMPVLKKSSKVGCNELYTLTPNGLELLLKSYELFNITSIENLDYFGCRILDFYSKDRYLLLRITEPPLANIENKYYKQELFIVDIKSKKIVKQPCICVIK